jgi:hypothetical protein
MRPEVFLLANLALGFYNVGTIWAHEVDIFRTWALLAPEDFHAVQSAHWRKLPYWVLFPVALAFAGAVGLVWYHPAQAPAWAFLSPLCLQGLSAVMTALWWGRWQAKLSRDPLGSKSPYLKAILRTHWIRTALITASALVLFAWAITTYE